MEHGNGQASLDEVIEALVAEHHVHPKRFPAGEPLEGLPVELSYRKAQLDRQYVYLPMRLYMQVAPLAGKASQVYQLAWRYGMMHSTSVLPLTSAVLRPARVTRHEKAQALACLEKAELITVLRQHGKNPQITVLALIDRFGRKPPTV